MDELSTEDLWRQYKETGLKALRDLLITRHLPLAHKVASRVGATLPTHIRIKDLESSGISGLIKAIDRFDPEGGASFTTYATLLIRGAIIDELRSLDWVPRSVHKKARRIHNAQEELAKQLGREATDEELADHLGLNLEELYQLLGRARPAILVSLDAKEQVPLTDGRAKSGFEHAHRSEFRDMLKQAVLQLSPQERQVLAMYYYEEMRLKEIGQVLGVGESRISQIHKVAIEKLRTRLEAMER